MRLGAIKRHTRILAGVAASIVLIVSFQNCGKAGFDSELESSGDYGISDAELLAKYGAAGAAKVQATPFAFDASFDTITYNSCADSSLKSYSTRGFFSLMAGAYSTGGVRINNDFVSYVNSNFQPLYGNAGLTENQYKGILADSPENAGAVPSLAMRVKNSLGHVYADGQLALDRDIIPLAAPLTNTLVMESLYSSQGGAVSYFPFAPERKNFEGKLTFNSDEFQADQYRALLASDAVLALTFMAGSSKEIYRIRPDSDSTATRAYGKGYYLQFARPTGNTHTSVPSRLLASIDEVDLQTGYGTGAGFACRYYTVVRQADAAVCPAMTASEMTAYKTELMKIRRHLRADQWDVNARIGCVIPKHASCYKEENLAAHNLAEVSYDPAFECHTPTNLSQVGTALKSKCAHYVSVCTKD